MSSDKPDFAMLIAKKKPMDPATQDDTSEPVDHAADLGVGKEAAEDSAIKDLMEASASKDVQSFKSALKDFLEACYPQLSDSADNSDDSSY